MTISSMAMGRMRSPGAAPDRAFASISRTAAGLTRSGVVVIPAMIAEDIGACRDLQRYEGQVI